jgi:hypothetical protein
MSVFWIGFTCGGLIFFFVGAGVIALVVNLIVEGGGR